jgi:hypothetical protein
MKETIEDGGPAFPERDMKGNLSSGMTLRDYFAGQALSSLIRHPDSVGESEETVAAWAYKAADAMLAERTK